jgi:AcrR family transcriptional regulator
MVLGVKRDLDGSSGRTGPGRVPVVGSNTAPSDSVSRALDAAEDLIYARGVQSVGMDEIRDRSGVPLKRLYQLFSSKENLVVAVLERRDTRWHERLSAYVDRVADPQSRVLAVFDWLGDWFAEPGFRGCAWINTNGEMGAVSPAVADQARRHKATFKRYLGQLVADAGLPPSLTDQLALLADGAMADAGIFATPESASRAREAAETLIRAARGKPRHRGSTATLKRRGN